jgi:antitoxin (DNA-binding transcriptional repressor) of toxin-antitoxin stability system
MKTFELEKAPPGLRQAARSLRGEVLVLTERGKPVFAVVGLADDFAIEALSLSRNKAFMSCLDAISAQSRRERRYSAAQLRKEFGLRRRSRVTKKPKGHGDRQRA